MGVEECCPFVRFKVKKSWSPKSWLFLRYWLKHQMHKNQRNTAPGGGGLEIFEIFVIRLALFVLVVFIIISILLICNISTSTEVWEVYSNFLGFQICSKLGLLLFDGLAKAGRYTFPAQSVFNGLANRPLWYRLAILLFFLSIGFLFQKVSTFSGQFKIS